ncbi:uncharacterized protein LOC108102569 [Drosophila eugracilis]|uniref:uncharacterized protein LOC108102569 n=1 Tax=Drosophila eugracilis TaxID=29029 RepID=UPI0007E705A2|nr:uncharacterized protein LOC108102569 [Drosophila eugracilis]
MKKNSQIFWINCMLLLISSVEGDSDANLKIMDQMLSGIDDKGKPCQNFYNSSQKNLKWGESPIVNTQFQILFDGLNDEIFKEHSLEEKVRRFYTICQGWSKAARPVKYFELVPPGENLSWPHLTPDGSEWPKEKFNWIETLARLRRYGMNDVMLGMNVRLDKDTSQHVVVFEKKYDFKFRFLESLLRLGLSPKLVMELSPLDTALQKMVISDTKWENLAKSDTNRFSLRNLDSAGLSLSKYLEIVFGHQFPPDFKVQVESLHYLLYLHELMETVDSQIVANYLMARFHFFTIFTLGKSSYGGTKSCVNAMRFCLEFASNLLYEERILGRKRLRSHQNQVGKVFEAMRNQLTIRVERNSLNLTTFEITSLQKWLKTLTLSIGNIPGKAGHRRFVTDFYKELEFDADEDFETAHLKVLELRTRAELSLLDQPVTKGRRYIFHSYPISNYFFGTEIEDKGNVIYLSYDLLADPSYDPDSHDIFKIIPLGIRFGINILTGLIALKCKDHDANLLNLFDDNQIITAGPMCSNLWVQDRSHGIREQYLLVLNLAHEAYFAEGSKFSQRQPNFTTMSLRELFFFRFGQSIFGKYLYSESDFVKGGPPTNSVTMLPAFVQAFNCQDPIPFG